MATNRTCSIDGCEGAVIARGWCGKHYQRWRKHGDPAHIFWASTSNESLPWLVQMVGTGDRSAGCWEWPGRLSQGYGRVMFDGRMRFAHRVAIRLDGRAVSGLVARHQCHNRACVNPDHLLTGTDADNARDKVMAGRCATRLLAGEIPVIRHWLRCGLSTVLLGQMYEVNAETIGYLSRGKTWTHVPDDRWFLDHAMPPNEESIPKS